MKISEAAKLAGIKESTLRKACSSGSCAAQIGGDIDGRLVWDVEMDDVLRWRDGRLVSRPQRLLAWMDEYEATYDQAAEYFGVSRSTAIKYVSYARSGTR
jgi:hypothetical protein